MVSAVGRPEVMRRRRRMKRLRSGAVAIAVVLAVVGVALGVTLSTTGGSTIAARSGPGGAPAGAGDPARPVGSQGSGPAGSAPSGAPGPSATGVPDVATSAVALGPAGVQAPWVAAENQRQGSTAWRITGTPPGLIAGYADHTSASTGDVVTLYVTTDAASFHVDAYRIGFYGGDGGRLVWSSPTVTGVDQPTCPVTQETHMVSCDNWKPSLQVDITGAFVPGDYLFKLVGSGGQQSWVPLTVRNLDSNATYLVENDIYTWQAWNPWGGYDFYAGPGTCPPNVYPICTRARVTSFDRPYGYGQGAADFLGDEYPLIRFVEQHGLDVTYETSADLEQYPQSITRHRVLMSLGHDECWSYNERQAAVAAEAQGVNMIFFGASPILRHVRLEPSPLGAYRQEVDYRDSSADPLDGKGNPLEVTGNTWSVAPASWSEVPFVGSNYTGYVEPGYKPVDMVIGDASNWLFAGTGLQSGDHVPGMLVSDFDQYDVGLSPANVDVLAHSPMPRYEVQTNVASPASDITYYTDPKSGAGIFDTGTVAWIPDLSSSAVMGQMTANLLHLFGQGPTGKLMPSTGSWRKFY